MGKEFKIYTKTGDDGTSGLIGGTRVAKNDARLEAYGTVDELNSWMGLLGAQAADDITGQSVLMIQNKLFVIGSFLATDENRSQLRKTLGCDGTDVLYLESEIDRMMQKVPPLTNFVLPGGNETIANIHIARTVCRRAERRISSLMNGEEAYVNVLKYVNRLSDFLFILSRYSATLMKVEEKIWENK